MKKSLCAGLALLLILSLCACSAEYAPGTCVEGTYESAWMKLAYTAPEGMTMLSAEELAQTRQNAADLVSEATGDERLTTSSEETIYEMIAVNEGTGDNLNIIVAKLPLPVSEEKYIEAFKQQVEDLGIDIAYGELSSYDLGGQTFTALPYNMALFENVDAMDQMLLLQRRGRHMISITLTYFSDEGLEQLLSGFSSYSS